MRRILMLGILVIAAWACEDAATVSQQQDPDTFAYVMGRASAEFNCPISQIKVQYLMGLTYFAVGCGCEATYECQVNTSYQPRCTRPPNLYPNQCMFGDAGAPDAGAGKD
jgi:hypothetical protein